MYEIVKIIKAGKATLIGEGEWVKDSAYQVYEYDGRFYAIIVSDNQNRWLMGDTLIAISEGEISHYI